MNEENSENVKTSEFIENLVYQEELLDKRYKKVQLYTNQEKT
jgi:hypothetical protein